MGALELFGEGGGAVALASWVCGAGDVASWEGSVNRVSQPVLSDERLELIGLSSTPSKRTLDCSAQGTPRP